MNIKLWIVPSNTLEERTIIELLLRSNELVLTTTQTSRPSWENLEPKIKNMLTQFDEIYGVQLEGKGPSCSVNVSYYIDKGSQEPVYAIEQVAKLLDSSLTIDEQFVLANSKGYIPAMIDLGKSLHMSDTFEKIQEIRLKDRQTQGITQQEEHDAIDAISQATNGLTKSSEKYSLIPVTLPHTNYSTVIDRLYGMYENLLITDPNNISHFYGSKDVLEQLMKDFEDGYTDGKETDGFYYWESSVDSAAIQNSIQKFIEERHIYLEDEKIRHLTPHDILNEQNIDEKLGRVMIETPNLKHLAVKPGIHTQKVSRKFYENGSIYTQNGTSIIEIKDKLHFMDDIDNTTQWEEPQKESDFPLSYEEKVLVLMNNGSYHINNSLSSKNSRKTLIPDMINLLRKARFSPEQFEDDLRSDQNKYHLLQQEVSKLSSDFKLFLSSHKEKAQPFPDYEKWCELSRILTQRESALKQLQTIARIAENFDSVIKDYESLYFKENKPKTSSEKKEVSTGDKKGGLEPFDD